MYGGRYTYLHTQGIPTHTFKIGCRWRWAIPSCFDCLTSGVRAFRRNYWSPVGMKAVETRKIPAPAGNVTPNSWSSSLYPSCYTDAPSWLFVTARKWTDLEEVLQIRRCRKRNLGLVGLIALSPNSSLIRLLFLFRRYIDSVLDITTQRNRTSSTYMYYIFHGPKIYSK